jgi:peptidyl-prolyl cis-trans isomerase C
LIKFLKEPLLQFIFIGACIYAVYAWFGEPDNGVAERTVYISDAQVDSLAAAWEKRWNRLPTEQELAGLVRAYVREDILYREALAMGLDDNDHIIRRRLAQKLEFLTQDVVRLRQPTEGELQAYFALHRDEFRAPDLITFVQVFFNPDKRGDATLRDAERALEKLQAAGIPDPAELDSGDRLMLADYYADATVMDVRRALGSGFADSIMQLEPGRWHGPVLSGFGTHLIYVYEFKAAPPPELDSVRADVLDQWQQEQVEQFNAEYFATLQDRYDIVIEGPEGLAAKVLEQEAALPAVAIPDGESGS